MVSGLAGQVLQHRHHTPTNALTPDGLAHPYPLDLGKIRSDEGHTATSDGPFECARQHEHTVGRGIGVAAFARAK